MGRIVVITGGTSGIGLALKELFEKNGDTVLTFSTRELDSPTHYSGSVSHEIKVRQVFNDIHEKYGKIDILINNAGYGMSGITELIPTEDIAKLIDVNYYGTLYCTRSALQYMDAGAKIINMSSAMALFPVPFRSIYGSAKAAVLNLSFSLKMELSSAGIDVCAICPGDVKTNFTANRVKDETTSDRYGDRLKTATEASDKNEDKRMPVEKVALEIFKTINKKKLKPFYIIGGKYKFLYFLTRITSKSLLLNSINKKLGGKMIADAPKKQKSQKPVENIIASESNETLQNVEQAMENDEVSVTPTEEQISETTESSPNENSIETVQATENSNQTIESDTEQEPTQEKIENSESNPENKEKIDEVKEDSEVAPATETQKTETKPSNSLNNLLNKMTGFKKTTETADTTTSSSENTNTEQ